jgi:hypothetical protein
MMGLGGRFETIMKQNMAKRAEQEKTKRIAAATRSATQLKTTKMTTDAAKFKGSPLSGGGADDIGAMARARLSADVAREGMLAEKEMEGKRLGLEERQGWAEQAFKRKKLKADIGTEGLFAEEDTDDEFLAPRRKRKKSAWSAYDEMDYLND